MLQRNTKPSSQKVLLARHFHGPTIYFLQKLPRRQDLIWY